jgi:hypothetical protein
LDSSTAVEGVAVQIGREMALSNSSGVVFVRTKSHQAVSVHVSPEDFAAAGRMRVVSRLREGNEVVAFVIVVEMF